MELPAFHLPEGAIAEATDVFRLLRQKVVQGDNVVEGRQMSAQLQRLRLETHYQCKERQHGVVWMDQTLESWGLKFVLDKGCFLQECSQIILFVVEV